MLFHHLLEPQSGVDIEQIVISLPEAVDARALRRAWQAVAEQTDVLRTAFRWHTAEQTLQEVAATIDVPLRGDDLRGLEAAERDARIAAYLREDRRNGFAMNVAPLMRLMLFRTEDAAYELVWTFHHALLDGRSFPLVLTDVFAHYDALARGDAFATPPVRRPYRDYIAWLGEQNFGAAESFWREQLRGFTAPTRLPAADPYHALSAAGERRRDCSARLRAATTTGLRELTRSGDFTLTTLVQAAWALVLSRHSGESDVVFGATRACRRSSIEGSGDIVGLFINTLPLRATVREDEPLSTLLRDVRRRWTDMRAWEHTPLSLVQGWSGVPGGGALFESIIVFENRSLDATLREQGDAWRRRRLMLYEQTNYPITLAVYGDEELRIKLQYDGVRFDDASMQRVLGHLRTVLEGIATGGVEQCVGNLPWLTTAEEQTLAAWNRPRKTYESDATLVGLFERHARRSPDRIALTFENERMTYRELDRRAERIARALQARGVARGIGVALCCERSLELVIAIIGTLKAGGYYIPLDPAYPAERLSFMLDDAQPAVLLTSRELRPKLPAAAANVVLLDADLQNALGEPQYPAAAVKADDPAYVIYTSGSTGVPKGTRATHRNAVRLLAAARDEVAFGEDEVWTLFHSYAFDFSVWEIWGALAHGGRLVIVPYWVARSTEEFRALLAREEVTLLSQTPSAFWQLLRADAHAPAPLSALRTIMLGGEAIEAARLAPWFERYGDERPRLFNGYGPTELTIFTTVRRMRATDLRSALRSPIGRALGDLRPYVLDRRGAPVPIGVTGELYVGGPGLTRGYLNRADLTRERFLGDPSTADPAALRYRTGDQVRWLPDGGLDYFGRNDEQLKIRGFRIEPGEVEAALLTHSAVESTAVIAREIAPGDTRLVGYVVLHDGEVVDAEALRCFLAARLPAHLVPARFVTLAALPLTDNGKLDRKRLPAPKSVAEASRADRAQPQTPLERMLASIWSSTLRTEHIGLHDNFFKLGGDSILTIQIVARAREAGVRITPRQLFDHPTIAALAGVATPTQTDGGEREPVHVSGAAPLTPVQRWFFETQSDAPHYWNQAFLFDVPPDFDTAHAGVAARAVVRHHDAFGARFERVGDAWATAPSSHDDDVFVERVDLANVSPALLPVMIESVCSVAQASLDIANGPLLRLVHIALGSERAGRFLIAVHHLVVDGVSWSVLIEDFERAYRAAQRGESAVLPAKTDTFAQWAHRLQTFARSAAVAAQCAYWNDVATSPSLPVPLDRGSREHELAATAQTVSARLTAAETNALLGPVPAAYGCRINDVLLAALASALTAWLGSGSLVVDLEGHGREDVIDGIDVGRTIGWFTTIFPVRLELGHATPLSALRSLAPRLDAIPQRGLGYGLLRYLAPEEPPVAASPAEIAFNYLGRFDQVVAGSSLFAFAHESAGPWHGPRSPRRHRLEVNSWIVDGCFEARWTFSRTTHRTQTIDRLACDFACALRALMAGAEPLRDGRAAVALALADSAEVADVYPLSPMQQLHLLTHAADDPGFEQWRYRLHGALDPGALHRAWQAAVDRHAILRTAFESEGLGEPRQVVRMHVSLPWSELDWRELSDADRARSLESLLHADRARGFVFEQPPLIRLTLVRMADDAYELIWSQHHLLLDRWSWPLLLADVATFYDSFSRGTTPTLAPPVAFADYVRWAQTQDITSAEAFWRLLFEGYQAPSPFRRRAIAHTNAAAPDDAAQEIRLDLSIAETDAVRSFSRAAGLSQNAVVAGAWALWLGRETDTDDVVFGVAAAGRSADVPGIERIVGVTTNNLPWRVKIERAAQPATWLRSLHAQSLDVGQYAFTMPTDVQRWSGVPSHRRLFETLLVFHDAAADARTQSWLGPAILIERVAAPTRTGYPLSLVVAGDDGISLRATHDKRYFTNEAVTAILRSVSRVLIAMTQNPDQHLGELVATLPAREHAPATEETEQAERARAYRAPVSAAERVVAGIWSELLGHERVGSADNFFELGGQSLLAMQIVARLRETFRMDVPIRVLFVAPTVAELVRILSSLEPQPGHLERISQIVERVAAMSSEEVQAFTRGAEEHK